MAKQFLFSMAFASLGLALPLAGCQAHAKVQVQTAKVEAPPPAPEPPKEEKPSPIVDNKIVLPGELEFDVNKATIKDTAQSREILEAVAKVMTDNPKVTKLRIEGHTDSSGRAEKNMNLSKARAESVAKWLTEHKIEAGRLTTVGLGPTKPITDNDTLEHRALNRRTEFHLQDVDGKPVADEGAVADRKQVASAK